MIECFLELESLGIVKVELDLSNYATKTDVKNETGIDTSSFAKKFDLPNLKSNVDKLDLHELKNVPTNWSNLKTKVDKLDVIKLVPVPVDLSKLCDLVKNDVVKKHVYNAKIKSIEDKIPDITNLATKTTSNAVESKIPIVSNLIKNLTTKQKLMKLKIKLLILIMINRLILHNLIS